MPKPTIWPKVIAATMVQVMMVGSLVFSSQNIG